MRYTAALLTAGALVALTGYCYAGDSAKRIIVPGTWSLNSATGELCGREENYRGLLKQREEHGINYNLPPPDGIAFADERNFDASGCSLRYAYHGRDLRIGDIEKYSRDIRGSHIITRNETTYIYNLGVNEEVSEQQIETAKKTRTLSSREMPPGTVFVVEDEAVHGSRRAYRVIRYYPLEKRTGGVTTTIPDWSVELEEVPVTRDISPQPERNTNGTGRGR